MNENCQSLPNITIKQWIDSATKRLISVEIPSAGLDTEILLAFAFDKDRTFLHAHSEEFLDSKTLRLANEYLEKRASRIPVAYITSEKDFYGRKFVVNQSTLIPRPESESIIEILKQILKPNSNSQIPIANLIDVGTGSGCIGITCKLEIPYLEVTLSDNSVDALETAKNNAMKHNTSVNIIDSDLLSDIDSNFDVIVANLPYVDKSWDVSIETKYEPQEALFANNNGLELIFELVSQSTTKIKPGGLLILESDPVQHSDITAFATKNGYKFIKKDGYILAFRWPN